MHKTMITSPMTGLPVEAYKDAETLSFVNPISGMMVDMRYNALKNVYEIPAVFTQYVALMTVESAAEYLDVSRQRVCKLIKDGRIKAVKHGLTQRPIESSVRAYAESERKSGRPHGSAEHDRACNSD